MSETPIPIAWLEQIVRDTLRDSVAANKRRAAIRQGRVEAVPCEGEHQDWDGGLQWCRACGVTRFEMAGGKYE